jgi:hypothetical protein
MTWGSFGAVDLGQQRTEALNALRQAALRYGVFLRLATRGGAVICVHVHGFVLGMTSLSGLFFFGHAFLSNPDYGNAMPDSILYELVLRL